MTSTVTWGWFQLFDHVEHHSTQVEPFTLVWLTNPKGDIIECKNIYWERDEIQLSPDTDASAERTFQKRMTEGCSHFLCKSFIDVHTR
jgi:hypothetical protein